MDRPLVKAYCAFAQSHRSGFPFHVNPLLVQSSYISTGSLKRNMHGTYYTMIQNDGLLQWRSQGFMCPYGVFFISLVNAG